MRHDTKTTIIFFTKLVLLWGFDTYSTKQEENLLVHIKEISHVVQFLPHNSKHFKSSTNFFH